MAKNVKEHVVQTIMHFDDVLDDYLAKKTNKELKILEEKIHKLKIQRTYNFRKKYTSFIEDHLSNYSIKTSSYIGINHIYIMIISVPISVCTINIEKSNGQISYIIRIEFTEPGSRYKKSGNLLEIYEFMNKITGFPIANDITLQKLIENYFKDLIDYNWLELDEVYI